MMLIYCSNCKLFFKPCEYVMMCGGETESTIDSWIHCPVCQDERQQSHCVDCHDCDVSYNFAIQSTCREVRKK